MCASTGEAAEPGIDLAAAENALRAALEEMQPLRLYEAVDHGMVARAIVAKRRSPSLSHVRFEIVSSIADFPRRHGVSHGDHEPALSGPTCTALPVVRAPAIMLRGL